MHFVGQVSGRPSILEGTIDEMLEETDEYIQKDVYGINLLGYRYIGDAVELNKNLASQTNVPICLAGSINSYKRLDEVIETSP